MFEILRGKSLVINQIVVMLILLMVAGIGLSTLSAMGKSADQMGQGKDVVADILPPPLYLIEAQLVSYDLLTTDTSDKKPLVEKLQSLKKDFDDRNRYWEASDLDQDVRSSLMGEQRKHGDLFWKEAMEQFLPAIQANNMDAARSSAQNLRKFYDAHRKGVDATVVLSSKYASDKLESLSTTAQHGYWKLGIASSIGLLLVLTFAVPTINRIYRGLKAAGDAAAAIASGDLTQPMPRAGKDEVGALIKQIAGMRDSLLTLIEAVRQNVESVAQASIKLENSANSSSQMSESQFSAASSMATSMEELSASIDQVEEHAHDARAITLTSAQHSENGGHIIQSAADEMRSISDAVNKTADTIRELEGVSGRISVIVKVIKEIADQTNLLALNAAIEAARAGEQGRGFAVVADEVRKLAERTAKATQEITGMISMIQDGTQRAVQEMESNVLRVNNGVELAKKAGDSVIGIRTSSEQVTQAVDGITQTLKEQVAAARELAKKVEQITQGAEQSSVIVGQTASSASHLEDLARQLSGMTSKFRIA